MPICIIGMHRSGTSMIARLLNLCGLDLGPPDELLGPHESNPLGHFENQGFLKINDALLAHFGGSWDNPPQLKEGWENDASLEPMVQEARALINNLSKNTCWGWKEPRTTILLPFWKSLMPDLRFVVCIRSPLEVAKSLEQRDRMPIEKGIYLWNQYMRSAIRDTEGCPRIFTFYEDFFENSAAEIGRLAEFCDLKTPEDPSSLYQTVARELKHHKSETAELLNEDKITTEYKLFYIGLRALSVQGVEYSKAGESREKLISDNIGRFLILLEKFHDEHEAAKMEEALAQKDVQVAQLRSTVQTQQQALGEKGQQVAQLQATVQAQQQAESEKEQQIAQLNNELNAIHAGFAWKIMNKYWAAREKFLPPGSFRRRIYDSLALKMRKSSGLSNSREPASPFPVKEEGLDARKFKNIIYSVLLSIYKNLKNLIPRNIRLWLIPRLRKIGINTSEIREALVEGTLKYDLVLSSSSPEYEKGSMSGDTYFNYLFSLINQRNKDFVPISKPSLPETEIKLIALYLPQFHPIPENDLWWGKGFTEWTNVTRGVPQFIGHYQPRLPGELGFYDLRLPEILRRQIELAKQFGVYGFCFHFYWFNGKRVLERPLEQFISNRDLDFPFCLSWANESWTRRWDGLEKEVLINQQHGPQDDIAFITYISKYLKDDRYIRIDSKPLLIVYRPALMPDARKTADRWRGWCKDNGIGEIFLAITHSFEHIDPREIGFDAAIEYAPNTFPLKDLSNQIKIINRKYQGKILDYSDAIDFARNYKKPPYLKFRGICPSWDNEARRPGRGTTLVNSSPDGYKNWLQLLCEFTRNNFDPEKRLIFVNAWNEWAEGAYLEPDRKFGYAYLQSTAVTLAQFPKVRKHSLNNWKILFVSHDACMGGAQSVLINNIAWIKKHTFIKIKILCLDGGAWLHKFKDLGDTMVLNDTRDKTRSQEELLGALNEFCEGSPDLIYGNSLTAGREYSLLSRLNAPIITHVHELEMSIKRYASNWVGDVVKHSAHFIACSDAVRKNMMKNYGVEPSKISSIYSSINMDRPLRILNVEEKRELKKRLGIDEEKFLVIGCGIGMAFRKGADLFIEVARTLRKMGLDNFRFCWIGGFDEEECHDKYGDWGEHLSTLRKEDLDRHVRFLGPKDKSEEYFQAGDIFLLTSREDPFPLVVLEAASCGLPTVCFADAGGACEFVESNAGYVVPYEDIGAMAEKVATLMKDETVRRNLGKMAREMVLSHFTFEQTAPHIFSVCRNVAHKKPFVSIIVPNYNYGRHLPRRLDSIFNQTFRDFEVILLDDASTDNSMEVLKKYSQYPDVRIMRNDRNSGSPFRQWLKGIDLAVGDILWIAEADDACEPEFLGIMCRAFENPAVKLAYCNSFVIDENGKDYWDHTDSEYLTSLSRTKWKESYQVSAEEEINDGLGIKNTILNASGVLFRKFEFSDKFRKTFESMKIAGDWYFIVHAISGGEVYYLSKKLNYHRRHSESVISKTVSEKKIETFFREFHTIQKFIFNTYKLNPGFKEKWESYLRHEWNQLCPGKPFDGLKKYYPFDEMRERAEYLGPYIPMIEDARR